MRRGVNTTSPLSAGQQGPYRPVFKKNCPPRGSVRVRTPPRGSDRVRNTGLPVSARFQKNARLVGRLGPGPRLVANRADVLAGQQGRLTLLAGQRGRLIVLVGQQGRCNVYPVYSESVTATAVTVFTLYYANKRANRRNKLPPGLCGSN